MERDIDYENNNKAYDTMNMSGLDEDGKGIKCKNYELCEAVLPTWWFDCKGNYLCSNCHMMFGTWGNEINGNNGKGLLEIIDKIECPLCFETKKGISQPKCNHFVCIECFKRCYYGDKSGEPSFPYPDIEEEYFEDNENPKWDINYPLIKSYNIEWETWENNKIIKYNDEENLRKCPICRK